MMYIYIKYLGDVDDELAELGVDASLLLELSSDGFADSFQGERTELQEREDHNSLCTNLILYRSMASTNWTSAS